MDPLGWGFEAAFYKKLQRLTYVVTIPNRVVHGTGHILNPSGRFLGYLDPWSHNQLNASTNPGHVRGGDPALHTGWCGDIRGSEGFI